MNHDQTLDAIRINQVLAGEAAVIASLETKGLGVQGALQISIDGWFWHLPSSSPRYVIGFGAPLFAPLLSRRRSARYMPFVG
jgi:hypothetical protein